MKVTFRGSAGQSFGAWLAPGVELTVYGDVNDYAGKGLSGGVIAVRPDASAPATADEDVIAGNTTLYGATSGRAFFRGVAGERFAVRNSGADAVVEGVGDHCCEYMTGGHVVVLGVTGRNFAAGMSGGIAYVLDRDGTFASRCNQALVGLDPLDSGDHRLLYSLLLEHRERTGSRAAASVLAYFGTAPFVKVIPHDYKRALERPLAEAALMADPRGFLEVSAGGDARARPAHAHRRPPRDLRHAAGRGPAGAGPPLHGLRHPVLPSGLPARQPDPGVERPRAPRRVARGDRPPARDQQLPRVHRPDLPGAVRGVVRAGDQRRPGDDQADRVGDHRARVPRGLGARRSRRCGARAGRSASSARAPRVWPAPRSSTPPATA